ncbi:hypothetical protein, partial [Ketobacter sp.]
VGKIRSIGINPLLHTFTVRFHFHFQTLYASDTLQMHLAPVKLYQPCWIEMDRINSWRISRNRMPQGSRFGTANS